MIKLGLKNFIVCLKHFFTPLGTLFLGLIMGLSIFLSGAVSCVKTMVYDIETYSENIEIDFTAVKDALWQDVKVLPWKTPFKAVGTIASKGWLRAAFTDCLNGVLGIDSAQYAKDVEKSVDTALRRLKGLLSVLIFFCALGFIGGYLLVRFLIRRNLAPRPFGKFFLDIALTALFAFGIVVICGLVGRLWLPGAVISAFLAYVLYSFAALGKAAVIHIPKKEERHRVLNFKNVGLLLASNLLILLLAFAIGILAVLITDIIVGVFILLPLFEIALCVVDLNAEAYALSVAADCAR